MKEPGTVHQTPMFEQIVEHVAHPIFVKDRDFRYTLVNRALSRLVGYPAERLLGQTDYAFFPREQADFFRRKDSEMFESGATIVIDEEPITDAAGRVHTLATTKVPLHAPSGAVTHLIGIIHDITGLKASERAQRQARDAAEALNRELTAFSYSVSHDLRAPLRRIDGFSQALLEQHAGELGEEGRGYLRRVRANAQQMDRLIDDLLELSRVTQAELRREGVDLSALGRAVGDELGQAQPERRVELVVAPDVVARGDPRLLRLVLENLLGNAWKFTGKRADARVELGASWQGGERVFFVRDNGAGFDASRAAQLFRAFSRLHSAEEFAGTGIGLATVQRIIHRHGGRIWAEGAVGRGASFYFTVGP